MKNGEADKVTKIGKGPSFGVSLNSPFVANQINPMSESFVPSQSAIGDLQDYGPQSNGNQGTAGALDQNLKKSAMLIVAMVLYVISAFLIVQFVIIVGAIVIGNLVIVNPVTGQMAGSGEKIIPELIEVWPSFLAFAVGIICLRMSRKISKDNKIHMGTKARIETMEEETGTVHKNIDSGFGEKNN